MSRSEKNLFQQYLLPLNLEPIDHVPPISWPIAFFLARFSGQSRPQENRPLANLSLQEPLEINFQKDMLPEIKFNGSGKKADKGIASKANLSQLKDFFEQTDRHSFLATNHTSIVMEKQSHREKLAQQIVHQTRAKLIEIVFQIAISLLREKDHRAISANAYQIFDPDLPDFQLDSLDELPNELTFTEGRSFLGIKELSFFLPGFGWIAKNATRFVEQYKLADAIDLVACDHAFSNFFSSNPSGKEVAIRVEIFQRLKEWLETHQFGNTIETALTDEWFILVVRQMIHDQLDDLIDQADNLLYMISSFEWSNYQSLISHPIIIGNYSFRKKQQPFDFDQLQNSEIEQVRLQIATVPGLIQTNPYNGSLDTPQTIVNLFSDTEPIDQCLDNHDWRMATFVQWLNALLFSDAQQGDFSDLQSSYPIRGLNLSSSHIVEKLTAMFSTSNLRIYNLATGVTTLLVLSDLVPDHLLEEPLKTQLQFLINELKFFAEAKIMRKTSFSQTTVKLEP